MRCDTMLTNNIVIAVRLDLSDLPDDERLDFVEKTSRIIESHIVKKLYPDRQHVLGYSMVHSALELDRYQQAYHSLRFARCVISRSQRDSVGVEQALRAELEELVEGKVLNHVFGENWDALGQGEEKEIECQP